MENMEDQDKQSHHVDTRSYIMIILTSISASALCKISEKASNFLLLQIMGLVPVPCGTLNNPDLLTRMLKTVVAGFI